MFHQPLAVKPEVLEDTPSEGFENYFDEHGLTDRRTWLVQTGELGGGKGNDYGLVSDGMGFEDSPDCERIASGINSKGPHGLAIGRQANMLQWGFYAAPNRMTASAQRAFLNAIVYMQQFDGHSPLVTKSSRSRDWLPFYIDYLAKAGTSSTTRGYLLGRLPKTVVASTGGQPKALHKWLRESVEFVYSRDDTYEVDEDLEQLGLSNRKPELLDWLITRLREDQRDEQALRVARRYLPERLDDAASMIYWLSSNKGRLFFSDVGGYRWRVDTRKDLRPQPR